MSTAVFPALIGLSYPIKRQPIFSTRIQRSIGGREVRIADYPYPIWEWTLPFDYLPAADFAALVGFFAAREGAWDSFLYSDPTDNSVTGQPLGTGDGTHYQFQLVRTLGPLVEPILAPNFVANVYLNGVSQPPGSWIVDRNYGTIALKAAPGNGVAVTADYTYYFRCRFVDDNPDFDQFMNRIWRAKQVRFRSLVNFGNAPVLLPAPSVSPPQAPSAPAGTKIYFEITARPLSGPFFGGVGEMQIGFCTGGFNLDDPSPTAPGDAGNQLHGQPLGWDSAGQSIGILGTVGLGIGAWVAGTQVIFEPSGISFSSGATFGVAVDLTAATFKLWTIGNGSFAGAAGFPLGWAGAGTFYPAVTMCYYGGENAVTINAGANPFVGPMPSGYVALDPSGVTSWIAYGSQISLTGNNLTANASFAGSQYVLGGVRASTGLIL